MHLLRRFLAALLLACAVTPAVGQTIKTLGYNTTNGQVVYGGTNTLSFSQTIAVTEIKSPNTNPIAFQSAISFDDVASLGIEESTRANLGFSTNLNTLWTATNASNARSAIGLGAAWLTNTSVTNFRTEVGLPLAALTNTSNVTMMRALAGSTNTNQPYSGSIIVQEQGVNDAVTITISNGIIVSIVQ